MLFKKDILYQLKTSIFKHYWISEFAFSNNSTIKASSNSNVLQEHSSAYYELFFNLPFQSMHFYMLSTKLDNIIHTYVHIKQIWKQQTLKKHSLTKAWIAKLIRISKQKVEKSFTYKNG